MSALEAIRTFYRRDRRFGEEIRFTDRVAAERWYASHGRFLFHYTVLVRKGART